MRLSEKIKLSFVMYESMLRELTKLSAYTDARTGQTVVPPTYQRPQIDPKAMEAWKARQGAASSLPTQVEPTFARSQQVMQQNLKGLPMIGGHGEYYTESLPKHMAAAGELKAGHMPAIRQAAEQRTGTLNQRLQASGNAYQAAPGVSQIGRLPTTGKPGTPVRIGPAPQAVGTANTQMTPRSFSGSVAHAPTQIAQAKPMGALAKSTTSGGTMAAAPRAIKAMKPMGTAMTVVSKIKGIGGKLLRAAV